MLNFLDKISKTSMPKVTAVDIICGNCCGNALLPIRTKLTTTGACAVCGGHSFVMAGDLSPVLARHIDNNRKAYEQELYEQFKQREVASGEASGNHIEIKSEFRN